MTEHRVRDLVTQEKMLVIRAVIEGDTEPRLEINVFDCHMHDTEPDQPSLLFAAVVRDKLDTPENPHIVQIMGGMPETFDSDTVIQFYDAGAVRLATVSGFRQKPASRPAPVNS